MTIWIAISACVSVIAAVAWGKLAKRARLRQLDGRRPYRAGELYQQHYLGSDLPQQHVEGCLLEIAETLDVPAELLRPGDRFAQELNAGHGWEYDDGLGILSSRLEARLRSAGRSVDVATILSVDDYIRSTVRQ